MRKAFEKLLDRPTVPKNHCFTEIDCFTYT